MRRTALMIVTALVAAAATAAPPTRWLNVNVVDHSDDTTVDLHLPLGLVTGVLAAVDTRELRHGRVRICTGHEDVDWAGLMKAVREAPEGEYVTVHQRDADVRVRKASGIVTIDATDRHDDEHVLVTVPESLLEAVSLDEDGRLDLAALVARLDATVNGDLVRVESRDANVRVWME